MKRNTSRCKWDIIHDILAITKDGNGKMKKTKIMGRAYVDWRNFDRNFGLLCKNKMVTKDVDDYYDITRKGNTLLEMTEQIIQLIGRGEINNGIHKK